MAAPRAARRGRRLVRQMRPTTTTTATASPCGIAEGGRDYPLGDTFPHEANYDRDAGVSFTKGCFVGQEVVARMQNKTVVRKRVVAITGTAPLTAGAEVLIGGTAAIGTIGSVDGSPCPRALAHRSRGRGR